MRNWPSCYQPIGLVSSYDTSGILLYFELIAFGSVCFSFIVAVFDNWSFIVVVVGQLAQLVLQ